MTLNADGTVSTLSLLAEVNAARKGAGEPVVTNSKFIPRVEDELDDLPVGKYFKPLQGGTASKYYDLTEDQAKQVAMRESKAVRKWGAVNYGGTYIACVRPAGWRTHS